jgi:DNA-binding transcriptional regulator YhcF (GntR family)
MRTLMTKVPAAKTTRSAARKPATARDQANTGSRPASGSAAKADIKPPSLTSQAYERIEEMIVTLELRPGTAVSEAELSARLGIGRTPVREALQRLAREHLVQILPQRGVLVSELDIKRQLRLLEVRREVERLWCGSPRGAQPMRSASGSPNSPRSSSRPHRLAIKPVSCARTRRSTNCPFSRRAMSSPWAPWD